MPVLGHYEFSAVVRCILVLTVDQDHDVGVLLETAAFPQVRQPRSASGLSHVGRPGELGRRKDGNTQIHGEALQPPTDGTHLLFATLAVPLLRSDQLKVVYQN